MRDSRVEVVETGQPPVQLLACALCGVLLWDIRAHYRHAHQDAAPQAEAYDHCCQHPKCPGGSLCCCASEQRLRDCWNQWREEIAGDSKQAFRDGYQAGQNDPAPWLTAPVLPSSGVDEEKLAEVVESIIRENWEMFDDRRHQAQVIARAVAAWLKGQGRGSEV